MKKSPIALVAAVALFAGWMAYLGINAFQVRNRVIVSHAQLLNAQYDIEAELELHDDQLPLRVKVSRVGYAVDDRAPVGEIVIRNIRSTRGFAGKSTYLIPLRRVGAEFEVAGLPIDPGYPRPFARVGWPLPLIGNAVVLADWNDNVPWRPTIYRLTPEVESQWARFRGK